MSVITEAVPKIRLPVRQHSENFDLEATEDEDQEDSDGEKSDDEHFFARAALDPEYEEDDQDRYSSGAGAYESDNGGSDFGDDEQDLRRQVEILAAESDATSDDSASTQRSNPVEDSECGPRSTDKAYIFCPALHRLTILRLFAKHASQHPLLPERHGDTRSAELLRRDAVTEMYRHCEVNRLCKVWAYLWNSWYRPERWNLWTRAAHPIAIPAHRTTMMVEALWRNLKCLTFQSFNRPPLDLATYAIIMKVIPPYR